MTPSTSAAAQETTPTILLIGAGGQIGQALALRLRRLGKVVAPSRAEADLERPESLRDIVRRTAPTVVVNAAAYTAVDAAEQDRDRCMTVNAIAPGVLAAEAARAGATVIHYSTNYVFDGSCARPYREEDPISPLSVYGESKALGERAVAEANVAHVILRTSAIYAPTGKNFVRRILELAAEREELRVVEDQIVSPTPADVVADGTMRVLERIGSAGDGAPSGIFHLTTTGATSWYGFARHILDRERAVREMRVRRLIPIASSEFPTPAARPANGVLDSSRFIRELGWTPPSWEAALASTVTTRS